MLEGPSPAAAEPTDETTSLERCVELIRLFDQIVQSRFDARVLAIEKWQLDDARALRLEAEADCAAGEVWFGISRIEEALLMIGVPPPPEEDGAARQDEQPDVP